MSDNNSIDPMESTVVDFKNNKDSKENALEGPNLILTVIQGNEMDFGKSYSFQKASIFIGRNKANEISIDDEKISKIHCELRVIKNKGIEQIFIRDLKSTNGTYVNGELIRQRPVVSGDKIEIGDTVLRLGYNDEIEKEYHTKLFDFAAKDSLTGLYNKRYIVNELENQGRVAKRNERHFSCAILDIDNFKDINDNYGHLAGDAYLKKFAQILKRSLRSQDIAGRVGGEEFLIILPETDVNGAYRLASRIRKKVVEFKLNFQGKIICTTISCGVGEFSETISTVELLLKVADQALYEAKKSGKNKVIRARVKENQ